MPSITVLDSAGVTQTVQTIPAVGSALSAASLPVVIASDQPLWPATQPVSVSGTVPVSGTFFQATQPVSLVALPTLATGGNVIGGVTQSGTWNVTVSNASVAVTGTFFQATQPVSIASMPSTPVTGTFWQATQPVSAASLPLPTGAATAAKQPALGVAGTASTDVITVQGIASGVAQPVSGTFWQSTQPVSIATMPSTPVTGAFWQATQPVSGTVTITPPTLTKGTQAATGLSVQDLKDAGRSCLALTAEFAFAQVAETLLTMTLSADGAATSTFSSRVITSGKKLRIQSVHMAVESLGSGTAPQRVYLRLRRNTAGATTTASPLQAVWACINSAAVVKSGAVMDYEYPDGLEMNGDGTATFGFTLETPDWVTTTATGRAKLTVIGYEY